MTGIDAASWDACRADDLVPTSRLTFSLDMTPDRDRGALVVAGEAPGDRVAVEVIEHTSDIERLVARTVEVALRARARVVLDRAEPASSSVPALERAGVEVRLISGPDFQRACGGFYDDARFLRLAHRGDYRLADAVLGATKRPVGDGWVWKRRGPTDISPLVAATLARWGTVSAPAELVPAIF